MLDARAAAALDDAQAGGDALAQLGDVGDDADGAAALAQAVEHVEHLVERALVERAEALVDEQRLQAAAARLGGDDVGEAEREREAGEERLAAGQRGGRALRPVQPSTIRSSRPARRSPRARSSVWISW